MRVVFAADHAGFTLKEVLRPFVASLGFMVEDCGAHAFVDGDDYPQYCARAAREVAADPEQTRAIVLGGSGQGEAMVANRFPGVRAVVWNGESDGARRAGLDEIALSREHNDANVLSIGARFVSADEAQVAVARWLETPFTGDERHVRRIKKIDAVEVNDAAV